MKFQVTFKSPDVLSEAIDEALKDVEIEGVSEKELEYVKEMRKEEMIEIAGKWIYSCHEYITVEIDTEERTCVVVPDLK